MVDTVIEQMGMDGEKHIYYRSVLEAAANAEKVMKKENYGGVEIRRLEDGRGELILRRVE